MSTDRLTSATAGKAYSSFGSDINLLTDVPAGMSAAIAAPIRRIRIGTPGSGALSIQYPDGATHTFVGLTQGETLDVQAVAILAAGTTVSAIDVMW